jgi:hypothetical protein
LQYLQDNPGTGGGKSKTLAAHFFVAEVIPKTAVGTHQERPTDSNHKSLSTLIISPFRCDAEQFKVCIEKHPDESPCGD